MPLSLFKITGLALEFYLDFDFSSVKQQGTWFRIIALLY